MIEQITEKIQTPCYVYDLDCFYQRVRQVKKVLGEDIPLTFSIKANPFLTGEVPEEICHVEVCSPGELDICKRVGQDPTRIIYSGVMKENEDIREAIEYGVDILTAESIKHVRMIEEEAERYFANRKGGRKESCKKYTEISRGEVKEKEPEPAVKQVRVLLRLSSGNQFGMDPEDIHSIIANRQLYPYIDFIGLHYYSGTQKEKERVFQKDTDLIEGVLDQLKEDFGFVPRLVEYGPGTKKEYFLPPDFAGSREEALVFLETEDQKALELAAAAVKRLAEKYPVGVEMGRFLAANCGTYFTKVMDQKTTAGVHYVILDGGIHQVNYYGKLMADMRGKKPPVGLACKKTDQNDSNDDKTFSEAQNNGREGIEAYNTDGEGIKTYGTDKNGTEGFEGDRQTYCLCGSLCTTADVLIREIELPRLKEGDVLAFEEVGAYSITEAMELFLSRNMPRVYLKKDGKIREVREPVASSMINCAG